MISTVLPTVVLLTRAIPCCCFLDVLEGELAAIRKEARELSANLATAPGEVQALRAQVTGQIDVIKGFAASTRGDKSSG